MHNPEFEIVCNSAEILAIFTYERNGGVIPSNEEMDSINEIIDWLNEDYNEFQEEMSHATD